jgi:ribosomal protein L7/L12
MERSHQQLVAEARQKVVQGISANEIISCLHQQGISIIDAMKVIREVYEISLGESKRLVTSNSAWGSIVKAAKPLHEELERFELDQQEDDERSADNRAL